MWASEYLIMILAGSLLILGVTLLVIYTKTKDKPTLVAGWILIFAVGVYFLEEFVWYWTKSLFFPHLN